MNDRERPMGEVRRINRVWVVLVMATLVTYALGESGTAGRAGMWATVLMFALTFVKGTLIALDYMALRQAPLMWRLLIMGWLLVVTVFIIGAYASSRILPH